MHISNCLTFIKKKSGITNQRFLFLNKTQRYVKFPSIILELTLSVLKPI